MAKKLPKLPQIPELLIPYESLVGQRVVTPILDEATQDQIDGAIARFTGKIRWEKWGMASLRKQGSLVLLVGPSGTGKTTIARYLAKKIGTGFIPISMADIGSSDPGQTEKNLNHIFDHAEKEGNTTIFMDECDGFLWSREKAGSDSMWMLSIINGILTRVEKFNGLCLLATNMRHMLDAALLSRITSLIEVNKPDYDTRCRLWLQKIPEQYPFHPTDDQLHKLASIELVGREIETAIINEAEQSIIQGRHPKFIPLCNIAKSIYEQSNQTSKIVGSSTKRQGR